MFQEREPASPQVPVAQVGSRGLGGPRSLGCGSTVPATILSWQPAWGLEIFNLHDLQTFSSGSTLNLSLSVSDLLNQ